MELLRTKGSEQGTGTETLPPPTGNSLEGFLSTHSGGLYLSPVNQVLRISGSPYFPSCWMVVQRVFKETGSPTDLWPLQSDRGHSLFTDQCDPTISCIPPSTWLDSYLPWDLSVSTPACILLPLISYSTKSQVQINFLSENPQAQSCSQEQHWLQLIYSLMTLKS